MIKRYVILGSEDAFSNELMPRPQDTFDPEIIPDGPISLKKLTRRAVRELERKVMLKVLRNYRWNRKRAASALGISYRAMLYKMKQAGLPPKKVAVPKLATELATSDG